MPPKVVKRGGAARRGGRLTRSAVKAQSTPMESAHEESVNIGELSGSDAVEAKEVDKTLEEENPIDDSVAAANPNDVVPSKKEIKDSVDDFGKDERLDLDDNEPEYEAEEYGGEEFEERELGQDDIELVNEEEEEVHEEIEVEEEAGEFEDEIGDGPEELESEHDDEHADEDVKHGGDTVDVEKEEHHDVLHDRRKRKEFEIFVGNLDRGATEDDLKKVFGHVGEVTDIRILKNPQTKKSKGSAFLRFATVEQAKRAVKELKSPMINGKKCGVTASQDNDTLFIGNICKTWTLEALREKLKHYGVENVDDITLVEDSNNVNMNRGYAFLEFSSRSDATDAHKRLLKKDVLFGVEKPAKVSFADSFLDPEDEIMAQVKTIFIDGLSPSWNEERVRDLLKRYGKLEKIELARNMPSARRKDFGFVTFDTHDAAMSCAKFINNSELGEGEDKAKVRARLSRPLQQAGKSRQSSRSDQRSRHGTGRSGRSSFARLPPRSLPSSRSARGVGSRAPSSSAKRAAGSRGRRPRPPLPPPARVRPLPPPARSYDRRPPVPLYPKASLKRDYGRRDDLPPPRSRPAVSYSSRLSPERHLSYRDDYAPRSSGYSDLPRSSSRSEMRRPYVDDPYSSRFERPPSYSEGRPRAYEPLPGSKRPYAALDDVPPRYADVDVRHSRARLDYDVGPSQYAESYGDRIPRSSLGYGSSRNSMSSHESRGPYSSRQGMDYGGGSYSGSDVGGMCSSSSYGGDLPRRDGGGSSYSSIYSSRGLGGSSYSGGGPGSYY
ncbi:PREDICTED: polyadenylate-binding protein 3 isoform X2 [Camelina sativa]|uniref:Polyadenylate-binding protein 3 isoform X1 n=1 Tax=Camelina sativa TaxID=90675 RepID=A0ABM1Q6K9_CAMSA|nr:PREDICTED: polyadenylate-binding protein 3 isoform X1 [Camelina sativa]XP_019082398.1 PREDICTED: polyadenylate-binding protein 3 isoform X1 [Camelina sativa]XP_019082399.1 PREDICTED: polyadenylate-binding protein 3 isoform X2 [Camelina sativa]